MKNPSLPLYGFLIIVGLGVLLSICGIFLKYDPLYYTGLILLIPLFVCVLVKGTRLARAPLVLLFHRIGRMIEKHSVLRVLLIFFSLYFGSILFTFLLLGPPFEFREYFIPLLTWFPMGILGLFLGEKAGIPGIIFGYGIYLLILIYMLIYRNQKTLRYIVIAFVLILILNVVVCITGVTNLHGF